MDASPLVNAQSSSRSAFAHQLDTPEARRQHAEAATQYAQAAASTSDSEALRILNLLEKQHKQLSTIVKSAADKPRPDAEQSSTEDADGSNPDKAVVHSDTESSKRPKRTSSPLSQRKPSHEMRTSIASNLASARGIPSVQQRSSGRAEMSNVGNHSARDSLKSNRIGDKPTHSEGSRTARRASSTSSEPPASPSAQPTPQPPPPTDHAFNKFYTSVEGIFSALSAPLAYAGLPLTQTSPENATAARSSSSQPPTQPDPKQSMIAASTPDVTKLFSRAALKAVKEDAHSIPIHESFAIVPATGGTMSYAKMLSHEERRARSSSYSNDDGNDAFVDAREHPSGRSSGLRPGQHGLKSPRLGKTFEELEKENESLKKLIDEYSKKLFMWQKSSQAQTREMQASIRLEKSRARPGKREEMETDVGRGKDVGKVRELEERVKKLEGELERQGKENEKLKAVVARYRQRWEELKAGAKMRRESPAGVDKGGA